MNKNNKLLKGMAVGAVVGAAISLLDRETRLSTTTNIKKYGGKLWSYAKNPEETITSLVNQVTNARNKIEELSEDVLFIMDKVNDIKETTEQVKKPSPNLIVKEDEENRE
ncbi:YtxH domain-containing protein [Bacillus sp. Marseille-P3661]|uniref:YtxH domain-containing protein n=1 Tax=Bacillus sp. Marseille-P3661 TaxID=1936234 RepID=UPI000C827CE0|nr:YtxH domain-containing protein [Bacillus sp. Marseille-P3661]